ncbi:MAG: O-succinylbenzoic acid--CoA ligase, partial [Cyanobacteria bacterium]|nr:O-succinylbenzoic acid--CoA ligase [Cyanobacteriota bacterium]
MGGGGVMQISALLMQLAEGGWVQLDGAAASSKVPATLLPDGPGFVISSGGSSGGRRRCLQPLINLDRSAAATGTWLGSIGIDPSTCLVLNPLPMHHVSGLMPWWRSRCWGSTHVPLAPNLLKQPSQLLAISRTLKGWGERPFVLSLVPTQLGRLLADPSGVDWLQRFSVIWVGGAALPAVMADQARQAGI